jgi:hypothetical protein
LDVDKQQDEENVKRWKDFQKVLQKAIDNHHPSPITCTICKRDRISSMKEGWKTAARHTHELYLEIWKVVPILHMEDETRDAQESVHEEKDLKLFAWFVFCYFQAL